MAEQRKKELFPGVRRLKSFEDFKPDENLFATQEELEQDLHKQQTGQGSPRHDALRQHPKN